MKNHEEIQIGILGAIALFFLFVIFFCADIITDRVELYSVTNNVTYVSELKVDDPVNINTATAEELMELEGIGETLAERIIEYRETQGGFEYLEDLAEIKGISSATVEKLRPYITL